MTYTIINDRNAGNSANTYWIPRSAGGRNFCIKFEDGTYLRTKSNKVRRFASEEAADKAANQS